MFLSRASSSIIKHGVCISSVLMPGRAGTSYPTSRSVKSACTFTYATPVLPQLLELYRVSQRWQSLDEASHATKLRDELSCLSLHVRQSVVALCDARDRKQRGRRDGHLASSRTFL